MEAKEGFRSGSPIALEEALLSSQVDRHLPEMTQLRIDDGRAGVSPSGWTDQSLTSRGGHVGRARAAARVESYL